MQCCSYMWLAKYLVNGMNETIKIIGVVKFVLLLLLLLATNCVFASNLEDMIINANKDEDIDLEGGLELAPNKLAIYGKKRVKIGGVFSNKKNNLMVLYLVDSQSEEITKQTYDISSELSNVLSVKSINDNELCVLVSTFNRTTKSLDIVLSVIDGFGNVRWETGKLNEKYNKKEHRFVGEDASFLVSDGKANCIVGFGSVSKKNYINLFSFSSNGSLQWKNHVGTTLKGGLAAVYSHDKSLYLIHSNTTVENTIASALRGENDSDNYQAVITKYPLNSNNNDSVISTIHGSYWINKVLLWDTDTLLLAGKKNKKRWLAKLNIKDRSFEEKSFEDGIFYAASIDKNMVAVLGLNDSSIQDISLVDKEMNLITKKVIKENSHSMDYLFTNSKNLLRLGHKKFMVLDLNSKRFGKILDLALTNSK